jgi:monofunctional biosynthetic peptidoglycan transglycosylase
MTLFERCVSGRFPSELTGNLGIVLKKIFFGLCVLVVIALAGPAWYLADLPDTRQLQTVNPQTSSIRMLRERQTRKTGKEPHSTMIWRRLSRISPYLRRAVVMSEDDTFYQHNGFDLEQIKRAAQIDWERKKFSFGGSTITQQLARTLYLSSRKNLLRKAKEALIARRLEKDLSKQRILELYLNVVEWGPQIYGAEAAARHFFNKPAIDLTPEEAVALTVILPSPRKWNPLSEKGFVAKRKKILYERMVRAGYIPVEVSSPTENAPDLDNEIMPGSESFPSELTPSMNNDRPSDSEIEPTPEMSTDDDDETGEADEPNASREDSERPGF